MSISSEKSCSFAGQITGQASVHLAGHLAKSANGSSCFLFKPWPTAPAPDSCVEVESVRLNKEGRLFAR